MNNFLNSLSEFVQRPYRGQEMDAFQWFLFLGLILIILAIWGYILNRVT